MFEYWNEGVFNTCNIHSAAVGQLGKYLFSVHAQVGCSSRDGDTSLCQFDEVLLNPTGNLECFRRKMAAWKEWHKRKQLLGVNEVMQMSLQVLEGSAVIAQVSFCLPARQAKGFIGLERGMLHGLSTSERVKQRGHYLDCHKQTRVVLHFDDYFWQWFSGFTTKEIHKHKQLNFDANPKTRCTDNSFLNHYWQSVATVFWRETFKQNKQTNWMRDSLFRGIAERHG